MTAISNKDVGGKNLRFNASNPIAARRASFLNMTQVEFAAAINVNPSSYSKYEQGLQTDPKISKLVKEALQLTDDELVDYESRRSSSFSRKSSPKCEEVKEPTKDLFPMAHKWIVFSSAKDFKSFIDEGPARDYAKWRVTNGAAYAHVFKLVAIAEPPTEIVWKSVE